MNLRLDRRAALRAGAVAAAAGIGLVSACGAPAATPNAAAAVSTGPPRRGGVLRAAFTGAGAAEQLNPFTAPTAGDFVRNRGRHAALGALDPTAPDGVRYTALDGIDVTPDLSVYTLRVRRGMTFTDGAPVTARDVLFSLRAPEQFGALPFLLAPARNFDLAAATVRDDTTVVLPTRRPVADGRLLLCQSTLIIRDGTTAFTLDMPTCGPYRLTTFDPGRGAALVRHDGFGQVEGGAPWFDELQLLSVPGADARAAALAGGQIDFAHDLGPVVGRTLSADPRVVVAPSTVPAATFLGFEMNLGYGPFTDPRVRTAVKLAVDRQAIVDTVLFGQGVVGNDLPGLGFPDYAADLPQTPFDPDRARTLITEAGAAGAPVELVTGPEVPGMVETATLVAGQLNAVGLAVALRELPAGQLFAASAAERAARQLATTYAPPVPALSSYEITTAGRTAAVFGIERPDVDALVASARGDADPAVRADAGRRAQRIINQEGNRVIPVYLPTVNGQVPALSGLVSDPFPNLTYAWLS